MGALVSNAPPKNREVEAAKARVRSAKRYARLRPPPKRRAPFSRPAESRCNRGHTRLCPPSPRLHTWNRDSPFADCSKEIARAPPPPRGPDRHRGLRRPARGGRGRRGFRGRRRFRCAGAARLLAHLPPAPGLSLSDRPRRVGCGAGHGGARPEAVRQRLRSHPDPGAGTLGWNPHPHRRHAAAVRHGGPGPGRASRDDRLAGEVGASLLHGPRCADRRERRARHPYRRAALAGRGSGRSTPTSWSIRSTSR